MAKVHTTDEISSPYFPQDFADYLIESGYVLRVVQNEFHSYAFEKDGEKCIQIIRDWVHLLVWNEEEPDQRLAEWSSVHQFSGISALKHDFFLFALLLHTMGAINIQENFRKTNNINDPSLLETFSSNFFNPVLS